MSEDKNKKTQQNKSDNGKLSKKPKFNIYWVYGIVAFILIAVQFIDFGGSTENITWHRFENDMLKPKDVDKVVIVNRDFVEIFIKSDRLANEKYINLKKSRSLFSTNEPHYVYTILSLEKFEERIILYQDEYVAQGDNLIVTTDERKDVFGDILSWIFPILFFVAIYIFFIRRMGSGGGGSQIFNIGKSKAQIFDKGTNVKVDFTHVAGLEEAKVEVMEIVEFLKHPKKYTQLGGKIPKGAILVGPPGTGKTLLAKAVAGEANVPFFSISGSDFVEMFVGVGASRVRDLFKQAKTKAPCIIFIDEIDAIGRARGRNPNYGANDERENTLNQLLTEMDGFGTNSGVIIIAATNRADILDKALMRAGRFDRQIHVELPELTERGEIFEVHLKPIKIDKTVDVVFLSKQTPGFSGADIANVCNEAALIAARKGNKAVGKQDFLDAVDRIIGGLEKRSKIITKGEKLTIAYHEAGHAAVSWLLEHSSPLVKVTIIPRGKALGAAWYLPDERQITTTEQILDEMCATLGGRASEEINFGKISTGALNDLERATRQASAMVSYFGMSEKIGNISFYDSTGQSEYSFNKPYSEKTAEIIDEEISLIVEEQYKRAKKTLEENKEKLIILSEKLLEKEVIFSEDLEEIFGKRPYKTRAEEEEEIRKSNAEKIKKEKKKEKAKKKIIEDEKIAEDEKMIEDEKIKKTKNK